VQRAYIGFYQRPADPAGLIYWAARLDESNGGLSDVLETFIDIQELQNLYGAADSSNISGIVNGIYRSFFGHHTDLSDLDGYVERFNTGEFTLADILLQVIANAQSEDLQSLNNKLAAADLFTTTLESRT
jgi:hypothetical protein